MTRQDLKGFLSGMATLLQALSWWLMGPLAKFKNCVLQLAGIVQLIAADDAILDQLLGLLVRQGMHSEGGLVVHTSADVVQLASPPAEMVSNLIDHLEQA